MTLKQTSERVAQQLSEAKLQCADPKLHAMQILEFVLGYSRSQFFIHLEEEISKGDAERIQQLVSRRLTGEPFQYLVGYEWFYECPFEVGPGVLIPRKETEFLVEALLAMGPSSKRVAELGAGSGNIGISVLRRFPDWEWHGYEKNPESLKYLKINRLGLLGNHSGYHIHAEDFFRANGEGAFDLLVSNPPYIVTNELVSLSLEVQREPRLALDGGQDGMEIVKSFFEAARNWLKPRGRVLSELGIGQSEPMKVYLEEKGWTDITILNDYAGIARVITAQKGETI